MRLTQADLDAFRDGYDQLSYSGQQEFYKRVAADYPEQSHWNAELCQEFLFQYAPSDVLEIGGWDGGLAATVLPTVPFVDEWTNVEIVSVPQVCRDSRYWRIVLTGFMWETTWRTDALIASHVIEHLSLEHIRALLDAVDTPAVFMDVPLSEDRRTDWRGSQTGHVLPLSIRELDDVFAGHGYEVTRSAPYQNRGFTSTVRWYAR